MHRRFSSFWPTGLKILGVNRELQAISLIKFVTHTVQVAA